MTKIIPAILPKRFYEIENAIEELQGATTTVQIDFVDGHVASNRTWMFNRKDEEKLEELLREDIGMPEWNSINYELDLMVKEPLAYIDSFMALGPSKIIFHHGTFEREALLSYFTELPEIVRQTVSFGIAVHLDQDPAELVAYAQYISTIQCMGIAKVGFQGQTLDERVYEQIRKAKELFPTKVISVDGGVTSENALALVAAGATALIVGSAIFQNSNPSGTLQTFKDLVRSNA